MVYNSSILNWIATKFGNVVHKVTLQKCVTFHKILVIQIMKLAHVSEVVRIFIFYRSWAWALQNGSRAPFVKFQIKSTLP